MASFARKHHCRIRDINTARLAKYRSRYSEGLRLSELSKEWYSHASNRTTSTKHKSRVEAETRESNQKSDKKLSSLRLSGAPQRVTILS